jgi:AcrR family transcriptional regulator
MTIAPPSDGGPRAQAVAAPPVSMPSPLDDELLSAARRALERHGVARATLARIAEEAGVSRVTLYRRGVTREAVLAALASRVLDDYRRAMWPALTARGSAAERLRRALGAACDVAEDGLGLVLVLGERIGGALGKPVSHDEDAVRLTFTEPLERLLRDGGADGSLRKTDASETATVLINLVGWTYVHLRAGPRWSPRRAKRATLRVALRGVLTEPPGGRSG